MHVDICVQNISWYCEINSRSCIRPCRCGLVITIGKMLRPNKLYIMLCQELLWQWIIPHKFFVQNLLDILKSGKIIGNIKIENIFQLTKRQTFLGNSSEANVSWAVIKYSNLWGTLRTWQISLKSKIKVWHASIFYAFHKVPIWKTLAQTIIVFRNMISLRI